MRILLTGATGYVGRFIAADALAHGDTVITLSRGAPAKADTSWPFDLNTPPDTLPPADALIHAAFDHAPGKYRGGEGDDPEGFLRRNRDGSIALARIAVASGIGRIVFLSSRAVFGGHPAGTALTDTTSHAPDTLYGRMKAEVEGALLAMAAADVTSVALRATGIYGRPDGTDWHKWADLFAAFAAGGTIEPRMGTELHGDDLAAAIRMCLTAPPDTVSGQAFNASDMLVDRHDLLAAYGAAHGIGQPPPPRAPPPAPNAMTCDGLAGLDWRPGGWRRLRAFLATCPPAQ